MKKRDWIKVIIKRPDEQYGHVANIRNTLESLQKNVSGYIEAVNICEDIAVICNEEGRLFGLPGNCTLCGVPFVGDIIFVGVKGEEFTDFPLSRKDFIKTFFEGYRS